MAPRVFLTVLFSLSFTYIPCIDAQGKKNALIFTEKSDRNYVVLHPDKPLDLSAFTLCMRLATEIEAGEEICLFSYHNMGDALNLWCEQDGTYSLYLLYKEGVHFTFPQLDTFWNHLCVTWESSSGLTAFWINGKKTMRKSYRAGFTIPAGGIVILGQDQDSPGGSFEMQQSFYGEIADVSLWDYVLTSDEIASLSEGSRCPKGNILDWESIKYTTEGHVTIRPINDYE
nr:PREDICTED: pentraxin fusion protein-like isoform X2 [Latimeria chalumnae]|eukprot:XP_014353429.1 PREDICTED: pentraxin fusion protein-like isoform X2 [Latimeria chalumnae]